jgi:ADP-ribose pyrophosphatase
MPKEYEPQRIFVAVKGVVMNQNRALIVRRNGCTTPDGRDWWEFPGGTLEFGENPEQTLVRELREETGLQVVPDRLLYVWSAIVREEYQIIIITYLCRCEDTSRILLSEEHSGYMWADKYSLREYLVDDIQKALDANDIWKLF